LFLREQGHQARLIPAQFVKPYRKSNKNDFIDAEAIAEAVTKQNMRFVQTSLGAHLSQSRTRNGNAKYTRFSVVRLPR
jgi:transposase